MKKLLLSLFSLCALNFTAQTVCNPSGNLMLFTNYDGGTLTINVDQNIPNLKIGICSYEACHVIFTGAFLNNVTGIRYAGFNNANTNCGGSIPTTTFVGAPGTAVTSTVFAPASTISNPNGYSMIICGYSCNNNANQGGCNTVDQVEAYFLNHFAGSTLYAHKVQYGCWTGTHSLSVGGNCCPPEPVYPGTISSSQTICPGATPAGFLSTASATISAGTIAYQWQSSTTSASSGFSNISGATLINYTHGAVSQTTYFRRGAGTTTNNVAYSNVITVTTLPPPPMSIIMPAGGVCQNSTATLTATGGTNYVWNPGGVNSSSLVITPTTASLITLTGTAVNGCSATVSQPLIVNPSPTINANAIPPNVCAGKATTLTAGGSNITWQPGNIPGSIITVTPTASQVYTATSVSGSGCPGIATVAVNVLVLPVIAVISNLTSSVLCIGQSATLSSNGGASYTWMPGQATGLQLTVSPGVTTIYTVTGKDSNGCVSDATIAIGVVSNPTIALDTDRPKICKGESVIITGTGATTYTLMNAFLLFSSGSIAVSPSITTNYTVAGTDANGCIGSSEKSIAVSGCVGIEESFSGSESVKLYPNPNTGEFSLVGSTASHFQIINNAGRFVKQVELNAKNEYKVLVNGLAPGIYFLVSEDQQYKKKIVVTK